MLTGVTGPMLFGVRAWLPFALYGGVVAAWSLVLWEALRRRAREIAPDARARGPLGAFAAFAGGGGARWHEVEAAWLHHAKQARADRDPIAVQSRACEQLVFAMRAQLEALHADAARQQSVIEQQQRQIAALVEQAIATARPHDEFVPDDEAGVVRRRRRTADDEGTPGDCTGGGLRGLLG